MRWRFTILRASKLFDGVTRWWTALALRLANQRARASTPHRGSKETILSESRDVAKMKKDSMTAIFPLYWDKSAHHEIRDFYAHMALIHERRFARCFCRYFGDIAKQYLRNNKNIWANKTEHARVLRYVLSFFFRSCVNQGNKKDARTRFTLRAQFFLSILPKLR